MRSPKGKLEFLGNGKVLQKDKRVGSRILISVPFQFKTTCNKRCQLKSKVSLPQRTPSASFGTLHLQTECNHWSKFSN